MTREELWKEWGRVSAESLRLRDIFQNEFEGSLSQRLGQIEQFKTEIERFRVDLDDMEFKSLDFLLRQLDLNAG